MTRKYRYAGLMILYKSLVTLIPGQEWHYVSTRLTSQEEIDSDNPREGFFQIAIRGKKKFSSIDNFLSFCTFHYSKSTFIRDLHHFVGQSHFHT